MDVDVDGFQPTPGLEMQQALPKHVFTTVKEAVPQEGWFSHSDPFLNAWPSLVLYRSAYYSPRGQWRVLEKSLWR